MYQQSQRKSIELDFKSLATFISMKPLYILQQITNLLIVIGVISR